MRTNKPLKGVFCVAPLACDLSRDGRSLGRDTLARCKKAFEHLCMGRSYYPHARVIVSAGFSPNRKTYPFQEKTMARLMAEELMSFGVKENELIIGNERWGSLGEIEEVWLQALHFATLHNLLDLDVRIVTSWYHSPRVRLIMWRIAHDVRSGVCRALQSSNKPPETYCLEYSTWSTSGSVTHALWELVKTPITALKLLGL